MARSGRVIQWYMQRVTGAALLVLLVMHFWVEHYAANVRHTGITAELVRDRIFRNPWFVAIDISFLLVALYHGLNGLRNIVLDYSRFSPRALSVVTAVLAACGIIWAYWGV